ncbi:threonine aldolase family protein [Streptomyces sp. NPDC058255]|uniref:threonine aldolase family protein n=1 Tax=Streptomyces sp. NPDC058255 TaxID=3346407 RepID=UPI0036E2F7EF
MSDTAAQGEERVVADSAEQREERTGTTSVEQGEERTGTTSVEQGEERTGTTSADQGEEQVGTTSADQGEEQAEADEAEQRRERRTAAYRGARRILARPGHRATLRERLAVLDEAAHLYDLDEPVDIYGNRIVEALEERVAGLLGMEAAAFFPTGTMAQQVALRCWAGRTGNATVALHGLSHPEVHERNALSTVSGLRPVRVTSEPRLPTADEVRDFEEPFGALMLELPLRDAGFVLPSWEELSEVVEAARERDAVVHFDGARLWECTPHFGRPLEKIAGLADSVYVSFYKSLGGYSGAALAGPKTLVDEAKTWRHRYGGMVIHQFPAVLSALAGLERELPRLPEYVSHARVVAAALREGFAAAGVPWARVHPEEPHTHEFQVWLPYDAEVLADASVEQAEETKTFLFSDHWDARGPGLAVTEVSVRAEGLEWTADDVKAAVRDFVERLPH